MNASCEMAWQRLMAAAAVAVLAIVYLFPQAQAQWPIDPCKSVDCQKGQCVANASAFLGFDCNCDKGWTKIDPSINFLGCFLPDCQMNFSCDGSASPPPPPPPPPSGSAPPLEPANLCLLPALCGNGDCQINPPAGLFQLPTYSCHCHSGYGNMFNQSMGPCLPQCNLNGNCSNLGLPIITAPPPPGAGNPIVLTPPPNGNEGHAPSPSPSLDEGVRPHLPDEGEIVIPSRSRWLITAAIFTTVVFLGW